MNSVSDMLKLNLFNPDSEDPDSEPQRTDLSSAIQSEELIRFQSADIDQRLTLIMKLETVPEGITETLMSLLCVCRGAFTNTNRN